MPKKTKINIKSDSVIGIIDYRIFPYALGDTFTFITNLQIIKIINNLNYIDFSILTLPNKPSSALQPGINNYNYINAIDNLHPAFLCTPNLRHLWINENYSNFHYQIKRVINPKNKSWPSLKDYLYKKIDYSSHKLIDKFYNDNGYIPFLSTPRGFQAETEHFKEKFLKGFFPVIINIRQRSLTDDQAEITRDSSFEVWSEFLSSAEKRFPLVKFVLVGGFTEWERSVSRKKNIIIPRTLGYGLGHELTLLLDGIPFIGTSSGFSAAATFSKTPYQITKMDPRSSQYIGLSVNDEKYIFACDNQWISWESETVEGLLFMLDRLYKSCIRQL